jgi:hypothetical protein
VLILEDTDEIPERKRSVSGHRQAYIDSGALAIDSNPHEASSNGYIMHITGTKQAVYLSKLTLA